MHRAYDDITSRLGEPLWWDERCVPRYEPFRPDLCGVYDREVALYLIACQACGQRFKVTETRGNYEACGHAVKVLAPATRTEVQALHFGDPPIHGCSGDTMNCDDILVLEFWRRVSFEWTRVPDLEIGLADEGVDRG